MIKLCIYNPDDDFDEDIDEETITDASTFETQTPAFDSNKPSMIRADDVIILG